MSAPYEEIVAGETVLRFPPGTRHEEICARLHTQVAAALTGISAARRLEMRSVVELSTGTMLRPDLALVTAATGRLWLVAEVISPDDHCTDTVMKKQLYEDMNVPRLWMVDPRYDNVEVYHGGSYGLSLRGILAQRDTLTEKLLPGLQLSVAQLFGLPDRDKKRAV